jgi:ribosomal protein S18 acetylase RimI-like enzyme
MTAINIRPATAQDLDDIARIHADALQPFAKFSKAMYGQDPRDALPAMTRYSFGNPQNIFSVAEDSASGQVVGFLRYKIVDPQNPPPKSDLGPPPPGLKHKEHLEDIWKRFNDPREEDQDAVYEEVHQGRRHVCKSTPHFPNPTLSEKGCSQFRSVDVVHLMINPNHQRKGIGRKLLQTAIDVSEAEAIPAILVSSRESHPLYSSLGFEDQKVWTNDNEYWAREIEQREKDLGITGCEGITEECAGLTEEEALMIRWPATSL